MRMVRCLIRARILITSCNLLICRNSVRMQRLYNNNSVHSQTEGHDPYLRFQ